MPVITVAVLDLSVSVCRSCQCVAHASVSVSGAGACVVVAILNLNQYHRRKQMPVAGDVVYLDISSVSALRQALDSDLTPMTAVMPDVLTT